MKSYAEKVAANRLTQSHDNKQKTNKNY